MYVSWRVMGGLGLECRDAIIVVEAAYRIRAEDGEGTLLVEQQGSQEVDQQACRGSQVDGSQEEDRLAYLEVERAYQAFREAVLRKAWVEPSWEVQLRPWAALPSPYLVPWERLCRDRVA